MKQHLHTYMIEVSWSKDINFHLEHIMHTYYSQKLVTYTMALETSQLVQENPQFRYQAETISTNTSGHSNDHKEIMTTIREGTCS